MPATPLMDGTLRITNSYEDSTESYRRLIDDTVTGERLQHVKVQIADSATDVEVAVDVDVAQLLLLLIRSDGALTVETNNGTTPDDTFVLAADKFIHWSTNKGTDVQLTVDITTNVFASNSSGDVRELEIIVLTTTP